MTKKQVASLITVFIVVLSVFAVSAQSISGVFSFSRGSLILSGTIRGLGNVSNNAFYSTLTGTAQVTALCQNRGGNVAPGQNPVVVLVSKTSPPLAPDSNGNADVWITITDAEVSAAFVAGSYSARDVGCPNNNWTVIGMENASARWVAATVNVYENSALALQYSVGCVDDGVTLSCN